MIIKRNTLKVLLATTALSGTQLFHSALAQVNEADEERAINLDVIVVQGNRPAETLESDAILSVAPQDLTEVLELSPEIDIGGATPNATRFYLRGFEATILEVTFDGVPAAGNLFQHRGAVSIIDPSLIDSVAIKTAPVAAADGPAALGGALQIKSIALDDIVSEEKPTYFGASFAASSINDALGGSGTAAFHLSDQVSAAGFFSYRDQGNFEDGNGDVVPLTASEDTAGFVKLQFNPAENHRFDISALYGKNEGLLPYGAGDFPTEFYQFLYNMGAAGGGPRNQTLEEFSVSARYTGAGPGSPTGLLYAAESSLTDDDNGDEYTQARYGGRLAATFTHDFQGFDAALNIGVDGRLERFTSDFVGQENENDSLTVGAFSDLILDFGRLEVMPGLRIDYLETDYDTLTFDHVELSPSIRAIFEVTPGFELFGGYGRSVRATNTLPASRAGRTGGATIFPEDGIDPESATQASVGARFAWTPSFTNSDGQLLAEVEYFTVDLENVVVFEGGQMGMPFSGISNASGEFTSEGVTASVGWISERFQSTLTYSHAELTDPADQPVVEIRSIAAARGDRLRWNNELRLGAGFRIGYALEAVDDLTRLPAGVAAKYGYVVHDARIDWSLPDRSPFSVALIARNLTDEFYIDQTSFTFAGFEGIPEPGRDLRLEVRAAF